MLFTKGQFLSDHVMGTRDPANVVVHETLYGEKHVACSGQFSAVRRDAFPSRSETAAVFTRLQVAQANTQ